jgi:hypothetical protein
VRVTVNVAEAPHPLATEESLNSRVAMLVPSQASEGMGVVKLGSEGHCTLDGSGSEGNDGASVSCTVTICDVVAVLLHASVAVQVRVTV